MHRQPLDVNGHHCTQSWPACSDRDRATSTTGKPAASVYIAGVYIMYANCGSTLPSEIADASGIGDVVTFA